MIRRPVPPFRHVGAVQGQRQVAHHFDEVVRALPVQQLRPYGDPARVERRKLVDGHRPEGSARAPQRPRTVDQRTVTTKVPLAVAPWYATVAVTVATPGRRARRPFGPAATTGGRSLA
jgi:hypothetical protein